MPDEIDIITSEEGCKRKEEELEELKILYVDKLNDIYNKMAKLRKRREDLTNADESDLVEKHEMEDK